MNDDHFVKSVLQKPFISLRCIGAYYVKIANKSNMLQIDRGMDRQNIKIRFKINNL